MIKMTNDDGSDFIHHYMSKPELPLRKQRNAIIVWSFCLIVLFLVLLLGASCKKKTTVPEKEETFITPLVKGKMEGTYQWYAGDSATADLILTTNVLNCSYCAYVGYDYYYSNLDVAKGGQAYYICTNGYNEDSLSFGYHSKLFKYVRK